MSLSEIQFLSYSCNHFYRLISSVLIIFALILTTTSEALESNEDGVTVITSGSQWLLAARISNRSFRNSTALLPTGQLVLFTISDSSLCPDCGKAEFLVRQFANNPTGSATSVPHDTILVMCDMVAPGAAPCRDVQAFPHLAGYAFAFTEQEDIDGSEQENDTETPNAKSLRPLLTLDVSNINSVDRTRIAEWLLSLPPRESADNDSESAESESHSSYHEHLAEVIEKDSNDRSGSVRRASPLHTYRPIVKPLAANSLEKELVSHLGVSFVLLSTPGCDKCAAPLRSLERLGKALAAHDLFLVSQKKRPAAIEDREVHSSTVSIHRVVIDANLREDLAIGEKSVDVPILLVYHREILCKGGATHGAEDTSAPASTRRGRWTSGCKPLIYFGEVTPQTLLTYLQRELNTGHAVRLASAEHNPPSPLATQLRSLKNAAESQNVAKNHGIATVFDESTKDTDVAAWLKECKTSKASQCHLLMISTWYTPIFPFVQQQINVFVGASMLTKSSAHKHKHSFAILDLADVTDQAMNVLSGELARPSHNDEIQFKSITSFCPGGVCAFTFAFQTPPTSLPIPLSTSDLYGTFSQKDLAVRNLKHALVLARGSRFYHISPARSSFSSGPSIPRIVPVASALDGFVSSARSRGCHILSFVIPRRSDEVGRSIMTATKMQLTLRTLLSFEALCRSLNATNDENCVGGEVRCVVSDMNRLGAATENEYDEFNRFGKLEAPTVAFIRGVDGDSNSQGGALWVMGLSELKGAKKEAKEATEDLLAAQSALFVRDAELFESLFCKTVNLPCRARRFVREIKVSVFESRINDPEFAKFILFGGGPSCPHTPLLLAVIERVARVHERDRHEVIIGFIDATQLSPATRKLYGVEAVPQMRFYPRGQRSDGGKGVLTGERYKGTTNAESIFDFIHTEMGYSYIDYDYRQHDSIKSVTSRNFADIFTNGEEMNKSHTVLYLYDTVISDRFALNALYRLDKDHFNGNETTDNVFAPIKTYPEKFDRDTIEFLKMDGRQFAKLASQYHLGNAVGPELPQLLFLPKGPNKLREFIAFDFKRKPFGAVNAAAFIITSFAEFNGTFKMKKGVSAEEIALRWFDFADDDLSEHRILKEEEENMSVQAPEDASTQRSSSKNTPIPHSTAKSDEIRPKAVKQLTIDTFKDFVSEVGDRVVLFYTTSCPHCKAYRPYFESTASHFTGDGLIEFGVINLEQHSEVGHMQGIQAIPSVKVFFEGSVDKSTDFRGEDFMGSKASQIALIEFLQSIRGTSKVAELDQVRALRDHAIPTFDNTSAIDKLITAPKHRNSFDFKPKSEALSRANVVVEHYDDSTYAPPLLLEVAMAYCGHCYHLNSVLIDLDNYFRKNPAPAPRLVSPQNAQLRFAKIDGNIHTNISSLFGIEEFPTLILFFTEAMANGTMRHKSVKYDGLRNNNAIGEFLLKYLSKAVHPSLIHTKEKENPEDTEANKKAPVEASTRNPFEEEALHQQLLAEDEEENAVFNETIAIFNPRLLRTALLRTSAVLVMTYALPRDQPFVLVLNELHRVLSKMPIYKKGMMTTAVFPEHLITSEIEELTGWSHSAGKPFISLLRGMVQPQIITFNSTSMKGIGEAPPKGSEDEFYDQPTPSLILQFLDHYARNIFVLPRSLNETTFMENLNNLTSCETHSLRRWAVLFTSYDCTLCHKMLQSTSYSAQAQMALHDQFTEVTVLDINRARRIYKQWGSPQLPALVVFEKSIDHGNGKCTNEVTSARVLRIKPYESGEEDLVVPKRRQVHEFIFGKGNHAHYIIRPSLSFNLNVKELVLAGREKYDRLFKEHGNKIRFAPDFSHAVASAESVSGLEDALRKVSPDGRKPTIVLIRAEICLSCPRIESSILTSLLAIQMKKHPSLTNGLGFVEVNLPKRSRTMERELIALGFTQLSSPSIYVVINQNGELKISKYGGQKDDSVSIIDFVFEKLAVS